MAGGNQVTFNQLIDLSNTQGIENGIRIIERFLQVYEQLIRNSRRGSREAAQALNDIVKSVTSLEAQINRLNPTIAKDAQEIANLNGNLRRTSDTVGSLRGRMDGLERQTRELTSEQQRLNAQSKEINRLNNERLRLEARLAQSNTQQAKGNAEVRVQLQQRNRELRRNIQSSLEGTSVYQREIRELQRLTNEYREVALTQGMASRAARELNQRVVRQRARITDVNRSIGQYNDQVGNYVLGTQRLTAGFRQLAAALGFTGLIFTLVSAFRSAFEIVRNFQRQNAILAGVLNTTRSEIEELTRDAERLGAITARSATQVTELQVAYARLGFSQQEILNLTEDTIAGSVALNAELDETAALVGAIVRTFDDLATTDADDILDQLTAATQGSALNFERLQTALPIVAGAANAAGISFTRTVALLGRLSDAGIDASMSATSLRNIFIESAAQGLSYDQILDRIANSQDQLTAANDEFGRRAAVSATILSNLSENVEEFEGDLISAGGTAQRVADEQLATLDGRLTLLSSAFEGLILSISNGEGAISNFASGAIEELTEFLSIFTAANEGVISFADAVNAFTGPAQRAFITARIEASRLADEAERQQAAQEEAARQAELNRDAFLQYQTAVEQGVTSFDRFIDVHGVWFDDTEESQEVLRIIQRLFREYADSVQEARRELENLFNVQLTAITQLSRVEEAVQSLRDFIQDTSFDLLGDEATVQESVQNNIDAVEEALEEITRAREEAAERNRAIILQEEREFEESQARRQIITQESFSIANDIGNQLFTNNRIRSQNELSALNEERERELAIVGDNEAARAAIEERFAAQERRIRIEQARRERNQALFNIAIQTAQRVAEITLAAAAHTAALNFVGAAIATSQIPIALAVGAVQSGLVLSQPLPAFEEGGLVKTDGPIITSEAGPELAITPRGKMILTGSKGPEIRTDIPKGSTIINNPDTERLLNDFNDAPNNNEYSASNIRKVIQNERNGAIINGLSRVMERENDVLGDYFKKAIKELPEIHQWNFRYGKMVEDVVKGATRYRDQKAKRR